MVEPTETGKGAGSSKGASSCAAVEEAITLDSVFGASAIELVILAVEDEVGEVTAAAKLTVGPGEVSILAVELVVRVDPEATTLAKWLGTEPADLAGDASKGATTDGA